MAQPRGSAPDSIEGNQWTLLKSCSELHLIPGAGHAESALLQPELYREYLYGFLDRVEDPA